MVVAARITRAVAPNAALFPNELLTEGHAPRELAERTFDVARWRDYAGSRHFAALEEPGVLADDIVEFFATLRG